MHIFTDITGQEKGVGYSPAIILSTLFDDRPTVRTHEVAGHFDISQPLSPLKVIYVNVVCMLSSSLFLEEAAAVAVSVHPFPCLCRCAQSTVHPTSQARL